jgi:hypothetical protein
MSMAEVVVSEPNLPVFHLLPRKLSHSLTSFQTLNEHLTDDLRIRLPLGRLHDLTHEEVQRPLTVLRKRANATLDSSRPLDRN